MFIDSKTIFTALENGRQAGPERVEKVLEKAREAKGLNLEETAILLQIEDEHLLNRLFKLAGKIKNSIYGHRVVLFAPFYVSNYCINDCKYCGYRRSNSIERRKLSYDETIDEVQALTSMGHKRLALETGEDPKNCEFQYVLEVLDTIYETSDIRRVNVNIPATTVEHYRMLKDRNIGTYILFQETYHQPSYEEYHPVGPKSNYQYHLTAFDRAMEGGVDDVGAGVLFGLYDYRFEVLALLQHNQHLEEEFGVGFHTVSVPRLKKAKGVNLDDFPYQVDDSTFKNIIAVIRLALPFTGIILSTREDPELRDELIGYGVSQISAGSCTGVGGYRKQDQEPASTQFSIHDRRSPLEMVKSLMRGGFIPSYCTACYRSKRTGERFMRLAKSGEIQNVCQPNAMLTLTEFLLDYGDEEAIKLGEELIKEQERKIAGENLRTFFNEYFTQLKEGKRDLYI